MALAAWVPHNNPRRIPTSQDFFTLHPMTKKHNWVQARTLKSMNYIVRTVRAYRRFEPEPLKRPKVWT